MPHVWRLLPEVDMHDGSACIKGCARLTRHFFRRNRHRILLRVREYAGQGARNDSFVADMRVSDGSAFGRSSRSGKNREHMLRGNLIAFSNSDFGQCPRATSRQFMLHFHGFKNDDALSL